MIEHILQPKRYFGNIDTFVKLIVKPSGYKFFNWNGLIYFYVPELEMYFDTNIKMSDLIINK